MKKVRSNDGTSIAFQQSGSGPALILVDGALCYSAFGPMPALAKALAPHFTVYSYDRRGRGESGDTAPYAVDREVEDIDALIREAGGSASVFGTSSGAALALEAANRLQSVRKLALYEAPFLVDDTHPPRPADYLDRMTALVTADRRADALKMFMRTVGAPRVMVAILPLTPAWSKLKRVAHTLPYDFTVLGDTGSGKPLPRDKWSSAACPALVMAGGKSPAWMQNAMKSLAAVLPHAQHRTLAGQTHMVKPQALAPALIEFFAKGASNGSGF
jgi:pimeloyl-ACP methyl ester carboxylesterase